MGWCAALELYPPTRISNSWPMQRPGTLHLHPAPIQAEPKFSNPGLVAHQASDLVQGSSPNPSTLPGTKHTRNPQACSTCLDVSRQVPACPCWCHSPGLPQACTSRPPQVCWWVARGCIWPQWHLQAGRLSWAVLDPSGSHGQAPNS